jgi:methionine sulfoxide reductase heme-binding subunit
VSEKSRFGFRKRRSSPIALWYASRATGIVCLVLMTTVVLLGIGVSRQRPLPGLPRFGTVHLHRYLSLLAVGFLAVHVLTAIADSYVSIRVAAVVLPFVSAYKPLWLGLGAVAVDLMAAVIVTSLVRARIGRKTWRVVHWLAYAAWPVAVVHGIGTGPDLRGGASLWLAIGCVLAVSAATGWRVAGPLRATPRARIVAEMLAAHGPGEPAGALGGEEPRPPVSYRPLRSESGGYEPLSCEPLSYDRIETVRR